MPPPTLFPLAGAVPGFPVGDANLIGGGGTDV